ncbi:efflux RND transporter periplasmic adaptor subunit [Thalassotalea sp. HSM 43]|uniref:efflux RND transporter periplasmic adaptor subunit n=1 Tax=Thalassotalea sp. HSM 43 TaxID=2552945 RepID=UPI001081C33E|nr:efflux RND transporter periplasmic adaptor subunit [Thalassotalea sp. HSM 43]QBY05242.1 efflux RND transporter periplasmic adaptor subunit [Thalassotalea sp. HSM 43]
MENNKISRWPIIFLALVLIALLAYINWPQEQNKASRGARIINVITTPVVMADFSDEFEALGTAKANEEVVLTAQYTDIIKSVHFNDGDEVKKGQILVELSKDEEEAKIAELQANLEIAEAQLLRYRELLNKGVGSVSQRDEQKAKVKALEAQLKSARAILSNLTIKAPFDGQLGFRQVSAGALVSQGEEITSLDDISTIKVDFNIPERFINTIELGQSISASNIAFADKLFVGKVTGISPRVDAVTRTVQIRAEIPNAQKQLRPGMLMSIILQRDVEQLLQIPESGIIPFEDKHFVFIARDGVAKRIDVVIGRRKPGSVEILSGIAEGEQIVIEGALKLRDGAMIKTQLDTE